MKILTVIEPELRAVNGKVKVKTHETVIEVLSNSGDSIYNDVISTRFIKGVLTHLHKNGDCSHSKYVSALECIMQHICELVEAYD